MSGINKRGAGLWHAVPLTNSDIRAEYNRVTSQPPAVPDAGLAEKDVPAWVQIRAGHELSELVRLVRCAPEQMSGFLHSDFEASALLWRWALKWAPHMVQPASGETEEPR